MMTARRTVAATIAEGESTMSVLSRRARRTVAAVAATLVGAALLAGPTSAAPAPSERGTFEVGTGPTAAVAAATTIPTTCVGAVHRAQTYLVRYVYRGQQLRTVNLGQFNEAEPLTTPRSITFVGQTATTDVFLSVGTDGALYRTDALQPPGDDTVDNARSVRVGTGWGGVRAISANVVGNRLYALTTTGGLYRYSISPTFQLRSLGPVATSGWSGVKFLSAGIPDTAVDSLVATTTSGALVEYLSNRSTGTTRGYVLKATGWGAIRHVSVGACSDGPGASLIAVDTENDVYGYYDRNAFDLDGADIGSAGRIAGGLGGALGD